MGGRDRLRKEGVLDLVEEYQREREVLRGYIEAARSAQIPTQAEESDLERAEALAKTVAEVYQARGASGAREVLNEALGLVRGARQRLERRIGEEVERALARVRHLLGQARSCGLSEVEEVCGELQELADRLDGSPPSPQLLTSVLELRERAEFLASAAPELIQVRALLDGAEAEARVAANYSLPLDAIVMSMRSSWETALDCLRRGDVGGYRSSIDRARGAADSIGTITRMLIDFKRGEYLTGLFPEGGPRASSLAEWIGLSWLPEYLRSLRSELDSSWSSLLAADSAESVERWANRVVELYRLALIARGVLETAGDLRDLSSWEGVESSVKSAIEEGVLRIREAAARANSRDQALMEAARLLTELRERLQAYVELARDVRLLMPYWREYVDEMRAERGDLSEDDLDLIPRRWRRLVLGHPSR